MRSTVSVSWPRILNPVPRMQSLNPQAKCSLVFPDLKIESVMAYAFCSDWYRVISIPTLEYGEVFVNEMELATPCASSTCFPSWPTAASRSLPESSELIVTTDCAIKCPCASPTRVEVVSPPSPFLSKSAENPTLTLLPSGASFVGSPYALAAATTPESCDCRGPAGAERAQLCDSRIGPCPPIL